MSLGSDYGQPFDDDLSAAVDNATGFGILTVASAGNGSRQAVRARARRLPRRRRSRSPRPQVPCAFCRSCSSSTGEHRREPPGGLPAVVDAADRPALRGPSSTATARAATCNGCAPVPGRLAHREDRPRRPRYMQLHAQDQQHRRRRRAGRDHRPHRAGGPVRGWRRWRRRSQPDPRLHDQPGDRRTPSSRRSRARSVRFDPAISVPLVGQHGRLVARAASARERRRRIKPEIGAPGASVSAIAGTGTGTGPFGGTSGAAPMVAGLRRVAARGLRRRRRRPGRARPPGTRSATACSRPRSRPCS